MSEETDSKAKEPVLALDAQQQHELALVMENGQEILNLIYKWLQDEKRKAGLHMKPEFDYPLRHACALFDWLGALGDIATGSESGICPECELLGDHEEGCSVDWELNREAMESSGPKHFDPKDGSAW